MSAQPLPQPLPHPEAPYRASNLATVSSKRPSTAIACARCDNWWTGLTACHCSACHRTFTGIKAFDMHRAGSHARGTRHCVDPVSVGLVPAGKSWPGWSRPGTWRGPEDDAD
jgi:hypothetical protein